MSNGRKAANPLPNRLRGEGALMIAGQSLLIRPSFAALVAAEAAMGSLLALVERAGDGRLTMADSACLLFHCIADRPATLTMDDVGEALLAAGLQASTPLIGNILRQIVSGAG